jgi:phage host-nuclease inhibitor protein Gam
MDFAAIRQKIKDMIARIEGGVGDGISAEVHKLATEVHDELVNAIQTHEARIVALEEKVQQLLPNIT